MRERLKTSEINVPSLELKEAKTQESMEIMVPLRYTQGFHLILHLNKLVRSHYGHEKREKDLKQITSFIFCTVENRIN